MKFILHRGLWGIKENQNSILAFKKALNSNTLGIETDIRLTKDNVFILYHDPLFKGKLVKNVLYKEFKKENIPKLTDLLDINTDKILLLEIKDFNMNLNLFLKVLSKYKRNIYIMSFSTNVIKNLKKLTNNYKLGVLNYIINTPEVYEYDFICLLASTISHEVINIYQKINVEVIGYGVLSSKDLKYNITYIIDPKFLK